MGLIPSGAQELFLGKIKTVLNGGSFGSWAWTAALYGGTNITPQLSDDYAVYSSAITYALSGGSVGTESLDDWGTVVLDGSNAATMVHAAITFTSATTTVPNIYGYCVFDDSDGLIYATQFTNGPLTIAPGLPITVVPQFTFFDDSQCYGS
jgi:hypothetical protein